MAAAAPVQFAPASLASRALAEGGRVNVRLRQRHDPEALLRRYDALKSLRSQFDTHWQVVADRTWPDWGDFTIERSPGERRNQMQFDSTAAYALERFAAVLETFLTPRAQTWHELRASVDELNEERGVKEWFDEVSKRLHKMRGRPESGFYGAMQVAYKSHGAFGNGAISIEPGRRGGIVYVQRHIRNVYVAHDDQGRIDTVYECVKLSLKAAVQRFGLETLPEDMRSRFSIAPFDRVEFVRCIFPDDAFVPGNPFVKPFAELTLEPRSKKVMDESGLFELPLIYSRYTLNPMEDYGRGPAMLSLADNLTLQEMEKTLLRAGQLMTRPPLLLPHDGLLGGGQTVDLREGALNFGGLDEAGNQLVKPMVTGGRPELGFEMQQQKRQNIRSAMLLDLFEILAQNPQMTATQAMLVAQERGVITAPIVGRLQQEMLGPIVHRELGLAWRMGLLPPLPDALAQVGVDYRVDYTSPATRSQRIEELVGITRTIEIAAPWLQTNPEYLEVLDGEEVIRTAAEITGVPAKVIRSKEAYRKIVDAQNAARQQQEQMAQLPELAKAAQSASAAAKDIQNAPALAKGLGLA